MSFVMQTEPDALTPDQPGGGLLKFLDPQVAAAITIVMGAVFGLGMNLAPDFMCRLHCGSQEGVRQFNERARRFTVQVGAGELSSSILFYCLFYEKTTTFKALQVLYAFWVYHQTRMAIEVDYIDPSVFWASVGAFAFLACTPAAFEEDTATMVFKVFGALWMAQGLLFVLTPELASTHWKCDLTDEKHNMWTPLGITMARYFGFYLLSAGAIQALLVSGVASTIQGMACWHLACGTWMVTGICNGEMQKAGVLIGPMVFWVVFHAIIVYALLAN